MKINKRLINCILDKKNLFLRDFLKDSGYVIKNKDKKMPFYGFSIKKFFKLEDIIYTIYFLRKENLIKISSNSVSLPNLDPTKLKLEKNINQIDFIYNKLEEIYGYDIEATLELFDFKKRRYKTKEQQRITREFWLPILIAIFGAIVSIIISIYK
jgi:hypothetical protein